MNTNAATNATRLVWEGRAASTAVATTAASTSTKRAIIPMATNMNPRKRRFRFMYIRARRTTSSIRRRDQNAMNDTNAITPRNAANPASVQNCGPNDISLVLHQPRGGSKPAPRSSRVHSGKEVPRAARGSTAPCDPPLIGSSPGSHFVEPNPPGDDVIDDEPREDPGERDRDRVVPLHPIPRRRAPFHRDSGNPPPDVLSSRSERRSREARERGAVHVGVHRLLLLEDSGALSDRALLEPRVCGTGFDDHDPDPERSDLAAEGVAQRLEGELRRAVRPEKRDGEPPRHGAHVDDAPAPLSPHRREDGPAHRHRPGHVHLELPPEGRAVQVLDRPEQGDPRVVHEEVDPARRVEDPPDAPLDRDVVRDVDLDGRDARAPEVLDPRQGPPGGVHPEAAGREGDRGRLPKPARAPREQCHPSAVHFHGLHRASHAPRIDVPFP